MINHTFASQTSSKIRLALIVFGAVSSIVIIIISQQVYAQTDYNEDNVYTGKQITISKNLQDDPLAQDILAKIEHTKKWIAEFENSEEERNELEKIRAQSVSNLQKDLKAWEKLWEEFTFDYAFERKTGIFWDQYNFTSSKIMAGRIALQEVISNGGNAQEARNAYIDAAKIKRSEIIEANSMFNVKHGFAYYNQQILFDSDGQFHDIISGDELRKYYTDFRMNPSYLSSNPNDESSWIALSTSIQAECREGNILIHRFSTDDYACVTEQTSEMWSKHKMGKPMTEYIVYPSNKQIAIEKFREDRIKEKVKNINNKIDTIYMHYDKKIEDLEEAYDFRLIDIKKLERENEKIVIDEYNSTGIPIEKFTQRIKDIRDDHEYLKQITLKEKEQILQILKLNHEQYVSEFIKNYEFISDVEIVWDSDELHYKAIRTIVMS